MTLPIVVSTGWMLVIFGAEIALLHLVLVVFPWFRLTAIQWKKVQYITLALGSLGIFGAISSARQMVARNMYDFSGPKLENDFRSVRRFADDYSTGTAVCITLVRSPYSPPPEEFNKAQHEFDQACQWFKRLATTLPQEAPPDNGEINWSSLPRPPTFTKADLIDKMHQIQKTLDTYNETANGRRELATAARQSGLEQLLVFLTPLLLSFALALQITKVTGELKAAD